VLAEAGLVGDIEVEMNALERPAPFPPGEMPHFPDVESILVAWHAREFDGHLEHLWALTEAEDLTLGRAVSSACGQRHHQPHAKHPHAKHADRLDTLAHTIAGANGRRFQPSTEESSRLSLGWSNASSNASGSATTRNQRYSLEGSSTPPTHAPNSMTKRWRDWSSTRSHPRPRELGADPQPRCEVRRSLAEH
jgi:hypothetical protein